MFLLTDAEACVSSTLAVFAGLEVATTYSAIATLEKHIITRAIKLCIIVFIWSFLCLNTPATPFGRGSQAVSNKRDYAERVQATIYSELSCGRIQKVGWTPG